MKPNIFAEKIISSDQAYKSRENEETILKDKILSLELQLRIYKQAESIGESGYWQINLITFETWYSDNLFLIYGVEPRSLESHSDTFAHFIHEDDKQVVLSAFDQSYKEKIPLHLEFRIVRYDGVQRHLKIISSISKNSVGDPLLTGITLDITERKLLELKLLDISETKQGQNELLRYAEQIGIFGSWQINLNTRQTSYSDNFFRVFGMKPSGFNPGLDYFEEQLHPDDKHVLQEVIQNIFERQERTEAAFRIVRSDGRIRELRLKGKTIHNAIGDPMVVGVVRDITSQTNLETLLGTSNEQFAVQSEAFRQSEKSMHFGVWTWDSQKRQLLLSDNLYVLFELKPQAIAMNFEFRVSRADGKIGYIRSRTYPISPSEGVVLIVGIMQDITDEILLNQDLKDRVTIAEMLSNNIMDKVCITDVFNNIIGWNSRSEDAFKLFKDDVIGKNIFDVFPQMKKPEVIERYNKVLNGEIIHVPQAVIEYLDGVHELTMIPIKQDNGQIVAVLCLLHDIAEHPKLKNDQASTSSIFLSSSEE